MCNKQFETRCQCELICQGDNALKRETLEKERKAKI